MTETTDKMTGVIYILTNPSFPDYVKIGYADNWQKRLKQLNQSECIPFAFRCYATYEVTERLADQIFHNIIDRLNPDLRAIETVEGKARRREFYAMSAEDVYSLLEDIADLSGTQTRLRLIQPDAQEQLDEKLANEIQEKAKGRRSPFSFTQCEIEPGKEIEFLYNPEIKATVKDDQHIEYEGETWSLSALAKKLKNTDYPQPGPRRWMYGAETLDNRRLRILREKEERNKESDGDQEQPSSQA